MKSIRKGKYVCRTKKTIDYLGHEFKKIVCRVYIHTYILIYVCKYTLVNYMKAIATKDKNGW